MDVNQAADVIEQEYMRLHALWLGKVPPALMQFVFLPSTISVNRLCPVDWGFDHEKNVLFCVIVQADVDADGMPITTFEDYAIDGHEAMYTTVNLPQWATWRMNLVHELCHEYEHKILRGVATQRGWDLFQTKVIAVGANVKWKPHYKHPVAFYSAIAEFGVAFQIDVEPLHDRL